MFTYYGLTKTVTEYRSKRFPHICFFVFLFLQDSQHIVPVRCAGVRVSSAGLAVSQPEPAWDLTALECPSVLFPSVAKPAEC